MKKLHTPPLSEGLSSPQSTPQHLCFGHGEPTISRFFLCARHKILRRANCFQCFFYEKSARNTIRYRGETSRRLYKSTFASPENRGRELTQARSRPHNPFMHIPNSARRRTDLLWEVAHGHVDAARMTRAVMLPATWKPVMGAVQDRGNQGR